MPTNILQQLVDLVNYITQFVDQNITGNFLALIKAFGMLTVKILEFFIQIIQSLIGLIH